MGKTRVCAAARKVRNAAKSKNLEFLSEVGNFKAQPYALGGKERHKSFTHLEKQQPGASNQKDSQKERKAKFGYSAGQQIANTSIKNHANKNVPSPSASDSLKQLENQQPGTSHQKQAPKGRKGHTHLERQKATTSGTNKLHSASINPTNSLSPAATDCTTLDEPQINVQATTSQHQVSNMVMDILMDRDESDTVNDGMSCEPPKGTGKTYARAKAGSEIEPQQDSIPQQIDLAALNAFVCVCGQQEKINDLTKRNEEQAAQIKKLKLKNEEYSQRCFRLTDALNSKVLGNPHEDVFTVIEGFATKEKLKKFSEAGRSSDFVFVKLLMLELWPSGLSNRSVTGRSSNNPFGRNGTDGTGLADRIVVCMPKIPLEPNKISYIEDRLEEHRLYRGDSAAVARTKAKECGRLMTRVIAYYGKKEGVTAD